MAGPQRTNDIAQVDAPCHGTPELNGAGWVCISAAVVGLRFRRNSGTGSRASVLSLADTHQPPPFPLPPPLPEQQQQQHVEERQQQAPMRAAAPTRCNCCCHAELDPEPGNPRDPHAVRVRKAWASAMAQTHAHVCTAC